MKPWQVIERAEGPNGEPFELAQRDDELVIRAHGRLLMSSRQHGSEAAMAEMLGKSRSPRRVLVGGLGLGYTLRAVLDRLGPSDAVVVAEVSAAVVAWNRGLLASLARNPLADARVELRVADVKDVLGESFDAILLDVDNGPEALTLKQNDHLYSSRGIDRLRRALRSGGRLVVWSAGPDHRFEARLAKAGFSVDTRTVSAREMGRGVSHTLFIANLS